MPYTVEDAKADLAAAYVIFLCTVPLAPAEHVAESYAVEYNAYVDAVESLKKYDPVRQIYLPCLVVRSYVMEGCEMPGVAPIWNRADAASPNPYDFSF